MNNYYRLFEEDITKWYKDLVPEALIVEGARQVGKTTGVKNWAQRNNIKMLYIDLIDQKKLVKDLCEANSYQDAITKISIRMNANAEEYEVIFLDEIQVHHDLLYLARLFKGQKIRLICSGSLLGLRLAKEVNRTDIGSKQYLRVYPLDFHEFLIWMQADVLLKEIDHAFENNQQLIKSAHEELLKIFYQYIIIGGMPRVVKTFIEANQTIIPDIYRLKESILKEYIDDNHNSQYTGTNLRKEVIANMDSIYMNTPMFLEQKNKRFKIDSLGKNMRYSNIEKPLVCLLSSNILIPSYLTDSPTYPLNMHKHETLFKLYYSDIGLLTSALKIDYEIVEAWADGATKISDIMGGVIENFVAIELHRQELYYYKTEITPKGQKYSITYELDFLFNWKDGSIVPCEVKSRTKSGSKADSYNWYNDKYKPSTSLFIGPNNLHINHNEIKIPLYAIFKIREWIK